LRPHHRRHRTAEFALEVCEAVRFSGSHQDAIRERTARGMRTAIYAECTFPGGIFWGVGVGDEARSAAAVAGQA
jgi:hypothetical protein